MWYKKNHTFPNLQNRLASLDKDNNPRHIAASPSNSSIRTASPNASSASSLHAGVENLRLNAASPISTSTHSRSTSSLSQQRIALLESPAFSYSAMSVPSEEDLLGNIDGSSDPLFAAQSDENIGTNIVVCFDISFSHLNKINLYSIYSCRTQLGRLSERQCNRLDFGLRRFGQHTATSKQL